MFNKKDMSTTHFKFDPTRIQTHDLQIMTASTLHATETPAVNTLPSVTSTKWKGKPYFIYYTLSAFIKDIHYLYK